MQDAACGTPSVGGGFFGDLEVTGWLIGEEAVEGRIRREMSRVEEPMHEALVLDWSEVALEPAGEVSVKIAASSLTPLFRTVHTGYCTLTVSSTKTQELILDSAELTMK
jgi:hypothetical protein